MEEILSGLQMMALRQIEGFGWEFRFVCRPAFQAPTAIVFSAEGTKIGVLEDDGRINMEPEITFRSS